MPIRFYNTLTRQKDEFVPLEEGKVGMYACGPTVYSFVHIGNLRTFMFQDLLQKHLKYRGYEIRHVMNITDVEDKIIRTCRETGEDLKSLTSRYTEAFFADLEVLGVDIPEHTPRATDHIEDMVKLVQRLTENGHTYEMDGSIYFKITSFDGYGKLSRFDIDTLQEGASGRVDNDEYSDEDARDFALWKSYVEDDGEVYWDTEIGKGRPGWHLECSCMSMGILGESFDIHCGGIDLVFPHHENEIAQSEAATGKSFVKYWIHAAHLNVDGQKISKSLGNTITLRTLLEDGHDPIAVRWALRSTHYRQPTNFSVDTLAAAKQSVQRIRDFRMRLANVKRKSGLDLVSESEACETGFGEALDDDLNISGALATVFDFIRLVNKHLDEDEVCASGAETALGMLDRLDGVTGIMGDAPSEEAPQEILDLVQERQDARRAKDFAGADAIRDELADKGWILEDTPDGPRVKPV
ncbi:MAG: cysteine--tRNA ligase [Candidatus Hydrogenedentota bacterium]